MKMVDPVLPAGGNVLPGFRICALSQGASTSYLVGHHEWSLLQANLKWSITSPAKNSNLTYQKQ